MMVRRGVMTPPSKKILTPRTQPPPTKSNRSPPSIALLQLCEFSHLKLLFLYTLFYEIILKKNCLMSMNQICNGHEYKLKFC